jgi:hypothetical protein
MEQDPSTIANIIHPLYAESQYDWLKWRLAYLGGRRFVNEYVKPFSSREDKTDFLNRTNMTYAASFAKVAVNEVKNSIFQRMSDVNRAGGTKSYIEAIEGGKYGVDLLGSTMTEFMGKNILIELLVMSKVGIYVDMPRIPGETLLESYQAKPYLYYYAAEDIRSWTMDTTNNPNEFSSILLRQSEYTFDPDTRLPSGTQLIYKHFWLEDGRVYVQFYNEANETLNTESPFEPIQDLQPLPLNITRIPFVVLSLSTSLMTDIADYQIALTNLNSSDIAYILKSNFPFYVEQFDVRADSPHMKGSDSNNNLNENEIKTGATSGRRYPIGTERPGFIHPSSEPLVASMKKEEQIKAEIRDLVGLTVTNLEPKSAASKSLENQGLEAGLSYIGLELQHAERQVGEIWAMYENSKDYPSIHYPEKYNLKTDEENRKESQQLKDLMPIIPSQTYQRNIAKQIAYRLLSNVVDTKTMTTINKEIDDAPVVYVPPDTMVKDVEQGLVGLETASKTRGYPAGEVEKAKQDHADRLARISIAQSKGAGNPDTLPVPGDAKPNKDKTEDPIVTDKTRGINK